MTQALFGKDGYELWMAYEPLHSDAATHYLGLCATVTVADQGELARSAAAELKRALPRLLGSRTAVFTEKDSFSDSPGHCIAGTYATLETLLPEGSIPAATRTHHAEGYQMCVTAKGSLCIASASERGLLYGVFDLLRRMSSGEIWVPGPVKSDPKLAYRMLNHWDNLDGSIERGYAGETLWQWAELPHTVDPRYTDYARACASVGINASVLNNVNTQYEILTTEYLKKTAAIASVLRAWGIQTFLSVNFASPKVLGGLSTADPLDDDVAAWWREKADEIYTLIPDFGGFLMKADSEGQPGPYAYGRTHADGANMFAKVLKPHDGIIIWRAFVYGHGETDRAKKAWADFTPLDGTFLDNVAVQVKNGPIDFMPREPAHPLFGAMDRTTLFMEFQIAQEYLGQGNHIVYLGPMWKETLDFDTHARGEGSTVGRLLSADPDHRNFTGAAAVSNTGSHPTWCGSHFHPLNLYAFGRLAWDYTLDTEEIAAHWLSQTFGHDAAFKEKILPMLMDSWEACIDYMTPLGLHHIMKEHHHYGPDPGFNGGAREDWRSTYYHRADKAGLGFDRTRNGSGAVDQYHPPVADMLNNVDTCPEKYLLWFHHVPWDRIMESGRTLKDELVYRYRRGVEKAEGMVRTWKSVQKLVDPRRYREVLEKLEIQAADAQEWEAVCTAYFMSFANQQ